MLSWLIHLVVEWAYISENVLFCQPIYHAQDDGGTIYDDSALFFGKNAAKSRRKGRILREITNLPTARPLQCLEQYQESLKKTRSASVRALYDNCPVMRA